MLERHRFLSRHTQRRRRECRHVGRGFCPFPMRQRDHQGLDAVASKSQSRRHREDTHQKISRRPDARRSVSKAKRNEILSDYHA
jgi:hypothetical protein